MSSVRINACSECFRENEAGFSPEDKLRWRSMESERLVFRSLVQLHLQMQSG